MAVIEQEREQEPIAPAVPEINRDDYSEMGKLFLAAADLIVRFGWRQEQPGDFDRGFCALGAIFQAKGDFDTPGWATFYGQHRGMIKDLIRFNDKPGRDPWEVVARLRELAKEV